MHIASHLFTVLCAAWSCMRSQEEARTTAGPPTAEEQVKPSAADEPEEVLGVLDAQVARCT